MRFLTPLLPLGAMLLMAACRKGRDEAPEPMPLNNGWTVVTLDEHTHSMCSAPNALMRQYNIGSNMYVGRSTNMGASWQAWPIGLGVGSMTFVSDLVGFSRHNQDCYRTEDGGHTWILMPLNPGTVVSRPGGPELYGLGSTTYLSTDEGVNWMPLGSNGPGDNLGNLDFTGSDTGYVTCNAVFQHGTIRRTLDGGQTWETMFQANGVLRSVLMRDSQRGVVHVQTPGGAYLLYRTSDGWVSRDSVDVTLELGYVAPSIVDRHGSLYTAYPSLIKRSSDNGATWTDDYVSISALNGVFSPILSFFQVGDTLVASGYWHFMKKVSP